MPTPDWRYEKSSNTVKALCRLLRTGLNEEQQGEVSCALHDTLKLMCDAITADAPKSGDLWTPSMVRLFFEKPEHCERWLELIDEPDFKPDYYLT